MIMILNHKKNYQKIYVKYVKLFLPAFGTANIQVCNDPNKKNL